MLNRMFAKQKAQSDALFQAHPELEIERKWLAANFPYAHDTYAVIRPEILDEYESRAAIFNSKCREYGASLLEVVTGESAARYRAQKAAAAAKTPKSTEVELPEPAASVTFAFGTKEVTATVVSATAWKTDDKERIYYNIDFLGSKRPPIEKFYQVLAGGTRDKSMSAGGKVFAYEYAACASGSKRAAVDEAIAELVIKLATP